MSAARKTDPATSHEAARINPETLEGIRYTIYRMFERRPVTGWTDDELVAALAAKVGRTPQRIRTARQELAKSHLLVVKPDTFRLTATRRRARVWVPA